MERKERLIPEREREREKVDKKEERSHTDDSLYFFIRSIREVGKSPTGISEDLRVIVKEETCQDREGRRYFIKLGCWILPSVQVRQSPDSIPDHCQLWVSTCEDAI